MYKKFAKTAIYMNDNVKQYSNRILNLLIRLLLQEQKQSDEDSPLFAHDGLSQYSDYYIVLS